MRSCIRQLDMPAWPGRRGGEVARWQGGKVALPRQRRVLRLPVRQGIGRTLMGRPSRGLAIGAYA